MPTKQPASGMVTYYTADDFTDPWKGVEAWARDTMRHRLGPDAHAEQL